MRLAIVLYALAVHPAPVIAEPLRVSIEDAMRTAVRLSHPVAAARATRDRATADITAARSSYLPQITISSSYVRTLKSEFDDIIDSQDGSAASMVGGFGTLPFGPDHAWRAGVDVTQLIWDGGRTGSTVALAKTARTVAELEIAALRAQAVFDATDAYYAAVLAERLVSIGEASLALAEQTFAYASLGHQQGTTSEFDMVRAQVTRDNQHTSVVRAIGDRDAAMVRLRRRLGVPLDQPLVLTSELAPVSDQVARAAVGVPDHAERVAVARARAKVDARSAEVRIARSARWPTVSAFTSYGLVDYPEQFAPDSDWRENWTVGVNLSLPLFTGFRTSAEIRGAKADRRAAEATLAEVVELAAVDERYSGITAEVAAATLAATMRTTELARRAYRIADVRYRQGVSTYLELSDARLAMDQAQVNQALAARDLQVARVRIALLPLLPLVTSPVELAPTVTSEAQTPSATSTATLGSASSLTPGATR